MMAKSREEAARASASLAAGSIGSLAAFVSGAPADGAVVAVSRSGQKVEFSRVKDFPIASIAFNPRNDYDSMDRADLEALAESIQKVGLLNPVILRRVQPGEDLPGKTHVLICGENRTRAAALADLPAIHGREVISPQVVGPELEDEIMEGENDRRRKQPRPNKKKEFIRAKFADRIRASTQGGRRLAGETGGNLARLVEVESRGKIPRGTAQRLIAEIRKELEGAGSPTAGPARPTQETDEFDKLRKLLDKKLRAVESRRRLKLKNDLIQFLENWKP